MLSAFLLSQVLVGIALVSNLVSFHFRKRATVLSLLTLSVALVSAHLFLLGETTAGLLTLYAVVYFLVSTRTTSQKIMWAFMAGGAIIFAYTYSSLLDWFVLVSTVLTLLSIFNPNQRRMREYQFAGTITRIVYYSIIFSPVGILLEVTLLISNVTSYYRFYLRKPVSAEFEEKF